MPLLFSVYSVEEDACVVQALFILKLFYPLQAFGKACDHSGACGSRYAYITGDDGSGLTCSFNSSTCEFTSVVIGDCIDDTDCRVSMCETAPAMQSFPWCL